jgi:long-chain acyl-CoA synthetase
MDFYNSFTVFSNKIILTNELKSYTYSEIINVCDEMSTHTKGKPLIFLLCSNSEEAIVCYLSSLRSGAVPLLINSGINEFLLINLINKYKPNYIWLPKNRKIAASLSIIFSWGEYILTKPNQSIKQNIYNDLALLLMTSGTTGSPLLVRQSYKNLISNTSSIIKTLKIQPSDKPITTLPFNYTYGLSILNTHLACGCEIILTEKSVIDKDFWNLLKIKKVTTFGGVPYTYQMLDRIGFEEMELPSLKTITQAGGKLNMKLSLKFAEVCQKKSINFVVMYGQTEATARMSYLPSCYSVFKAGSIGMAIPNGKFLLEDENGKEINKPNVSGELIYKGENVCLGYAENCEDLLKGNENNGVLRTGDIAYFDEDGFYYIKGRIKRFIKIFGNRISLDEIENLAKENNFNCVCSGIDDKLYIFSEQSEILTNVKTLITKMTGIHPSSIQTFYIQNIPRNESGKVLYNDLNHLIENQ